jgi:hypothetical protein
MEERREPRERRDKGNKGFGIRPLQLEDMDDTRSCGDPEDKGE